MTTQIQNQRARRGEPSAVLQRQQRPPRVVAAPRPIAAQPGIVRPVAGTMPARPVQPETRPVQPGNRPGEPSSRPQIQPARPNQPETRPGQPEGRPGQPQVRPVQPTTALVSRKYAQRNPKPTQPNHRFAPYNRIIARLSHRFAPCSRTTDPLSHSNLARNSHRPGRFSPNRSPSSNLGPPRSQRLNRARNRNRDRHLSPNSGPHLSRVATGASTSIETCTPTTIKTSAPTTIETISPTTRKRPSTETAATLKHGWLIAPKRPAIRRVFFSCVIWSTPPTKKDSIPHSRPPRLVVIMNSSSTPTSRHPERSEGSPAFCSCRCLFYVVILNAVKDPCISS